MNPRYAFQSSDLTALLDLDLADPADQDDIEAVQDILLRRSVTNVAEQLQDTTKRTRGGPTLHLVRDPTTDAHS